jgi:hypothetical protein
MPDQTVPTPDPYAELAAELRRTADDIEKLIGSGLPMPSFIQLSVQPGTHAGDETTRVAIDTWALALLGRHGSLHKMSDGTYHYDAEARRGPLSVQLYNSVSTEWALAAEHGEEIAKREAEIERLRAELAALKPAEYGRAVDNGDASAEVPNGVEGGPVTGRASVPTNGGE